MSLREIVKRRLPAAARDAIVRARDRLAAPPLENIVLHDYAMQPEDGRGLRLTLVLPSIAPAKAFGGVTTGLDIFLELGKRTGAELRIMLDEFERGDDRGVVDARARTVGLDPARIGIAPRTEQTPVLGVRADDVFISYNWWATLNLRPLLERQAAHFGVRRPLIYLIQEYEPLFYPFSSTHMLARLAFEPRWPCWGLFNSSQLFDYFRAQGHEVEQAFVFEPKLSGALRPWLDGDKPAKAKRLLVYGRPTIPRNCHPAIEKGLRRWAERYPEFADWEVVSAGMEHKPAPFAPGRAMRSLGKLSLSDYAQLLRGAGAGLSLMSSPHPSYPPLEMAHFGLRTVTNAYANKDLATAHDNIISVPDILPDTIADALAEACRRVEADPAGGWRAQSHMAGFLDPTPFPFIDGVAEALRRLSEPRRSVAA